MRPSDETSFSPKVIIPEMLQLGIPASLLFGVLYVIPIPKFVLRFASDPLGYVMQFGKGDTDAIGPFIPYLYDLYLAIFGLWILCYIFFSLFAAVCWHYRFKHAYRIADIKPEVVVALHESFSQHEFQFGSYSFPEKCREVEAFCKKALIQEFRSRKSLVRYLPFFRSWTDLPVEGSIGSVFSQGVLAIFVSLILAWTGGQVVLLLALAPIVLASSLFSFVFVWIFDISHETRAATAVVIAYMGFAYFWTSGIAGAIGDPYLLSQDIRRVLQQRTNDAAEA